MLLIVLIFCVVFFGGSVLLIAKAVCDKSVNACLIRVITNLPNSEQSYKGKVKTHKYINRQRSILLVEETGVPGEN